MAHKNDKVAALVEAHSGKGLNAHYLAFFDCFNRQLYFEAHEVLEAIWLPERGGSEDRFYKGLIQLAGAFVHLQKQRPGPAGALFRLAYANLSHYSGQHQHLDVAAVLRLISEWLIRVETAVSTVKTLSDWEQSTPKLVLQQE